MLRTILVLFLLAVLVSGHYGVGPFDRPVPPPPGCAATLCAPGFQCVERAVNCYGRSIGLCPPTTECVPIQSNGGCAATLCAPGFQCVERAVNCYGRSIGLCPPTTECVPIQSNGGCAATLCLQGTRCIETVVNCFVAPCPVLTECIDILPGGISCANLLCAPGFQCVERAVNCFGLTQSQCPPSAECVPTTGQTTRPGCPVLPPTTVGICVNLCSTDADCRAGSSCCSNGCGHVCNSAGGPIIGPIVINPPNSMCPSPVPGFISWTSRICSGDFMCQNDQRCCSTSNGKRCISTGGYQQRPTRIPIGTGYWLPYNNNNNNNNNRWYIRPIG